MPAKRYRYIGDAPTVHVPDMHWGDLNDPELSVHPGDVSDPYEGDGSIEKPLIVSEVLVPVGSDEEKAWLDLHPEFKPTKKGGDA